ncbi:MAG: DNA-processing protein DprA [Gammaproteobacteria bacterium]|nr:DNA-processing protein DprA [Gammaproteobacteria bacterium]
MPVLNDMLSYWLALNRASGVGPMTQQILLDYFATPKDIFSASPSELESLNLKKSQVDSLLNPDWPGVEKDLVWSEHENNHICVLSDENYPSLLRQIPDPPLLLYVLGNLNVLGFQQIAIVGSRTPTPMGKETAYEFAHYLASIGLVVCSGLALGIDTAAHRGALAAGGMTIAVAGTGLDRVYPAKNRDLAYEIAASGALVSEFPLETSPRPGHFPRRNRIISGLSRGVLVVEAALKSGSLITAHQALEQGREVFAVPGSIHNPLARGCNALIRQGAKLVETGQDILEEIPEFLAEMGTEPASEYAVEENELDEEYLKVLENVGFEPTSVDTVIARSGLTAEAVCSMLLVLELQGYISLMSGGQYYRSQ